MKYQGRIIYLEILRVISIIFVVNIHVSASETIANFNTTNINYWWIQNISDSVSRWCVPIFVMISGALLLNPNKTESLGTFYKKRGMKMVVPFLFWGIIYVSISANLNGEILNFGYYFKNLLEGTVYWHMWFMYMIIAVYAMTPILRVYVVNADPKNIMYFLMVIFLSTSVLGVVEKFFAFQFNSFYQIEPIGGYLGYFLLGYYIHNFNIMDSIKKCFYLGAGVSIGLIVYGTFYLTKSNNGVLDEYFYSYTNPFVLLVSIAIFLFIKNVSWIVFDNSSFIKIVFAVSSSSFGIYIIHPLVMKFLYETNIAIVRETFNPLIRIPLLDVIILFASFIAVIIIRKIPYLKLLVP